MLIPYETVGFPPEILPNESGHLTFTWDDLLWAGRDCRATESVPRFSTRHGISSIYEAFFRWSLVRMALEQRDLMSSYLCRTNAAKALDPTEKGAVNYFLGMTVCKLFATRLLNTPWLLHLDVFRPRLDPVLTGVPPGPRRTGPRTTTMAWMRVQGTCQSAGRCNQSESEGPSAASDFGIHRTVRKYLTNEDWNAARKVAVEAAEEIKRDGYQPDGLRVIAGDSWREPYKESFLETLP